MVFYYLKIFIMADVKTKAPEVLENVKKIELNSVDQAEVEKTFSEASDFRNLWEKITAPLDSIISETAKVIDKDPIMNVSDELSKMNTEVKWVYDEIINNDWTFMKIAKSIPIINWLAKTLDAKMDEAKFNIKSVEWKLEAIFSWFDQSTISLNTSIDIQTKFLKWIEWNLWRVVAYKEFLTWKVSEFKAKAETVTDENEKMKYDMFLRNVEYFLSNLVVLIGNLEMARKRLLMRLDSATKLSLAMNSSRPIFKTLLSNALIETSSQKALDASMKALDVMWETIDKMSWELTDKAIESSLKSEELTSKPILSTSVFVENVTKLKNHFEQIESYRADIKTHAEAEKILFVEAKDKLDSVKVLSQKSQEELATEISR